MTTTPAPAPVAPPTPGNLKDPAWWQATLSFLLSFATGIGVLVGHPFKSDVITAVIPSVAFLAAVIVPAFFVHGAKQVQVAKIHAAAVQS